MITIIILTCLLGVAFIVGVNNCNKKCDVNSIPYTRRFIPRATQYETNAYSTYNVLVETIDGFVKLSTIDVTGNRRTDIINALIEQDFIDNNYTLEDFNIINNYYDQSITIYYPYGEIAFKLVAA